MGPVRNQGKCEACYAFAVLDSISALMRIYYSKREIILSVQEIIDCGGKVMKSMKGCRGGTIENTFAYAKLHGFV